MAGIPIAWSRYSEELGTYYHGGLVDRIVHVAPQAGAAALPAGRDRGELLREATRRADRKGAEQAFLESVGVPAPAPRPQPPAQRP